MVRVGTLRERDQLVPKVQHWFRSAQPWATGIGALRKNEKGRPSRVMYPISIACGAC
jgi:hypothetical protein